MQTYFMAFYVGLATYNITCLWQLVIPAENDQLHVACNDELLFFNLFLDTACVQDARHDGGRASKTVIK